MAAGSAQAKRGQSLVEAREFFDDPEWIGKLAESLPFRELLRYRFKGKGHINVLEGDGPSRNRPVASPTKEVPLWFSDLAAGKTYRFDIMLAAARVPRLPGRWLRLLLLLAGDVERNPGPVTFRAPCGALDLSSGFATTTKQKMTKSLDSGWEARCSFPFLLYSPMLKVYLLVYAITAVQDRCRELKGHLTPAWQIDKKWQLAEPGECRPVISQPVIQAATALALCWGWLDWAAVTLIGFLCMLHPSEIIPLKRSDLVLPSDAMSADRVAYVHVRNPKTVRFARRQHSRLEDPTVLAFVEQHFGHLPLQDRLFRGSMHTYRRQWNAIMSRLGVPHTLAEKGATPGVLRGSGATFLYLETEDISLVAWRGRWSKIKTVEFYLQEVAAQLLLQQLPPAARARIAELRRFAGPLLLSHCANNCGDPHVNQGVPAYLVECLGPARKELNKTFVLAVAVVDMVTIRHDAGSCFKQAEVRKSWLRLGARIRCRGARIDCFGAHIRFLPISHSQRWRFQCAMNVACSPSAYPDSALGAVGGFVGGVFGGVFGGVIDGVRGVACNSGEPDKDACDDENIFEQRAKLDQVLQFFELEYEKFSGYFEDPQRMESMRVEYYNCINAIEFQNEVLSQLVEELLGLRSALRKGEALNMSRKDLSIRLANLKLDISDRKTKRFFKEKERRQLVETLSPAIADAKTQRLLAEQAAGSQVEVTPVDVAPAAASMEAFASDCDKHPSSGTRQRRYKHYSDAELASLLREK
ncbi:unnamed protein product, partial [Symbiodinium pilosum]